MSSLNQIKFNLFCLGRQIIRGQKNKAKFHARGVARAVRQIDFVSLWFGAFALVSGVACVWTLFR